MFNKVSAVVLLVRDFETCLTFYRDTLGLEVVQLEPKFAAFKMQAQDFALQEITQAVENFNVNTGQTGSGDQVMLCTQVEDVDAAYEMLKAQGVEFVKPPTDQYWGIRAAYFRDPEGNFWEIAQPISTQS
jgi:lactoylglutathione lyase